MLTQSIHALFMLKQFGTEVIVVDFNAEPQKTNKEHKVNDEIKFN
jgi:hypothetical protein